MIISRVRYHRPNTTKQNTKKGEEREKKQAKKKQNKTKRQQKKAKYASRVHHLVTEDQWRVAY